MEKQFVTYKIALKLKELGFNEDCFGYYSEQIGGTYLLCIYQEEEFYSPIRVEAPLWQQAIDWFRVNYKIDVRSTFVWKNMAIGSSKIDCYIPHCNKDFYEEEFETYEEARDQAILKALELIEYEKK